MAGYSRIGWQDTQEYAVDYDPSGWIVRDAFMNNLKFYGISNTRIIDLIHPDMLTPEEIKFSRYLVPIKIGTATILLPVILINISICVCQGQEG